MLLFIQSLFLYLLNKPIKTLEPMDYSMYLFSNLIKFYDKEFADACYDEQWDDLPSLYDEYDKSKFNVDTKGEYECMENFLKDKYKK